MYSLRTIFLPLLLAAPSLIAADCFNIEGVTFTDITQGGANRANSLEWRVRDSNQQELCTVERSPDSAGKADCAAEGSSLEWTYDSGSFNATATYCPGGGKKCVTAGFNGSGDVDPWATCRRGCRMCNPQNTPQCDCGGCNGARDACQ
ncbi:hypothetical protein BU24DRAFT_91548 [Aaosphaeria arxii CBS 175.79]|uniref:Uncharacterized protein n=1 Tax=Aaosphaeria arxii CBS 175.79 TaxID=1450172 RepID=A0A6A5X761_9PLEO|nr:uncharacterized protein BU24DRAFT_91548 [Aaosphaeria arxii CBS 175.79]KAF2008769.1 hypothetical protein BU24DRAFT_91548 [Aaosphaeria arxii CBS 175.79]